MDVSAHIFLSVQSHHPTANESWKVSGEIRSWRASAEIRKSEKL